MKKRALTLLALVALGLTGCAKETVIEPEKFSFTLTQPVVGGSIASNLENGNYEKGTEISLNATENENYTFEGYYENDVLLSESSAYTFSLIKDTSISAKFVEEKTDITYEFTLTQPVVGGSITSSLENGTYKEGTEISLSAKANENYSFEGYYENDVLLSDTLVYTFSLTKDTSITAKFVEEKIDTSDYVEKTFSHKFIQSDFSGSGYSTTAGSKEINGLTWEYDAFTFLGQSSDGIQIGSKKAPQKDPWAIKTNFNEEIILTSVSIGGKHTTGTKITLDCGSYKFEETVTSSTYDVYTIENINTKVSSLSLALSTTAKSIYFDNLTFTCFVKKDSSLNITTDEATLTPAVPGENGVPQTVYKVTTKEEYYKTIDFSLEGEALKTSLNTLISNMKKWSYGDDTSIMLYTDANPSKPQYLYGIYDGDDIAAIKSGIWNKEHVWACSQMGLGGDSRPTSDTKNESSDLHNLRVSCQNSNGEHGNKFFDNENTNTTFFPNIEGNGNLAHSFTGDHRGDVARILFYMATRYTNLHLNDALDTSDDLSMGKLSVLKSWHEADPVDEFELSRNNRIYEYQGNRNPYIDYPELVSKVF